MKPVVCAVTLALVAALVAHTIAAASADIGIVLMHGKWGSVNNMVPLARELESRQYLVNNVEMAWSGRRLYDVDYPAALKEIESHVRQLRANGARRVVVCGHSMGSNAAVAYALSGFDLDGLVILSPGHFPERGMGKRVRPSLERARSMVAANRGAEFASFDDFNQGKPRSIKVAASTYLSYFDPDGLGAITKNVKRIPKAIPVLLVIGTADPFYPDSKAMFDSAPPHPLNRYVVLDTDHASVRSLAAAELLQWVELFAK